MMKVYKKFIYIANWKMYLTYDQSIAWLRQYDNGLKELSKNETIIVCPNFFTLAMVQPKTSKIKFGAQTCSSYAAGAYTGEINAQSLNELGVLYCIVGHSERRKFFRETLDESARKITTLFLNAITPILCVSDEYQAELQHIMPQITVLLGQQLIIAYEPLSAIGTGMVPSPEKIEKILSGIKKEIINFLSEDYFLLVYGGSVSSSVIHELKNIALLDGFLIGKASTDFQELKKIVEYK